jgi:hypothetical protein
MREMFSPYYVLALLAVAVSTLAPAYRLPLRLPARVRHALSGGAVTPLAVVVLVTAQAAYLRLLLAATYAQHPLRAFMAQMPVRFISGRVAENLPEAYRNGFALLAIVEACALFALYCGLARPARWKYAVVACGALLALTDATLARAATSADMYSYVGFTLLGLRAYAPPPQMFPGAYALINTWWHTPLVAAPYGPLWLGVSSIVAGFGDTLFAKIVALRLLGAGALFGSVAVLLALRVSPRIVALIALDPALVFEFVGNVHNDLFGVLLLLLARYAAGRGALRLAIVFAVMAGLVKLPFLLFAALAFARVASPLRRVRAYGISLALGTAVSWLVGGRAYLTALTEHVDQSTAGHAASVVVGLPGALKVAAVAIVALALSRSVFREGYAWALPALGALVHPWYLCWTLPYAVEAEATLCRVAIALPVVMVLTDTAIPGGTVVEIVAALGYLWLAVSLVRDTRRRFALRESRT